MLAVELVEAASLDHLLAGRRTVARAALRRELARATSLLPPGRNLDEAFECNRRSLPGQAKYLVERVFGRLPRPLVLRPAPEKRKLQLHPRDDDAYREETAPCLRQDIVHLAEMLGVQRPTITNAARELERAGV